MTDYNDFESWPEITIQPPTSGGKLYTKYGNLIAYVDAVGNLQLVRGMNVSEIESGKPFGITNSLEYQEMENKISAMILKLKAKHNGH